MIKDEQKNFMEELRALDEPTKRKILVVAVAVSMIVVVYLWLAYFNSIVSGTAPSVAQSAAVVNIPAASGTGGVLGLFATTMASFWQAVKDGAGTAIGTLENARQYNISPR
jgi:type IV secretory pathway TrbL component